MAKKKIVIVTGGTGFIGSHTIVELINSGYYPVSIDNYANSSKKPLKGIKKITGKRVKNYNVDLTDYQASKKIFKKYCNQISGIIHFAALKSVGDSVNNPLEYFHNNLNSLITVLRCMKKYNVKNLIFSSSCSVYGNSKELPVKESTPFSDPESPYARTKQISENIIKDFVGKSKDYKTIMLRYFNPAGAHDSIHIGESSTNKATNLIPVITETAIGKRPFMTVFGDDYQTRDGSCIRDYVHVIDLADAHVKAFEYVLKNKTKSNFSIFNLGIGDGVSVFEAINAFEKVSKQKLNYQIGKRRIGDVESIYADPSYTKKVLKWEPKKSIEDIMYTAWEWEKIRSK